MISPLLLHLVALILKIGPGVSRITKTSTSLITNKSRINNDDFIRKLGIFRPKSCTNVQCRNLCSPSEDICQEGTKCRVNRRLRFGECCPGSKCLRSEPENCEDRECPIPCSEGNNPCQDDEVCKPTKRQNCKDNQICKFNRRVRKDECCLQARCINKEPIICDSECPANPCMEGENPCFENEVCTPASRIRPNECCLRAKCSPLSSEGNTIFDICVDVKCDDPCEGNPCGFPYTCHKKSLEKGQCCQTHECLPPQEEVDCRLVKCGGGCYSEQNMCTEKNELCIHKPLQLNQCCPNAECVHKCSLIQCYDPCITKACGANEKCEYLPIGEDDFCPEATCSPILPTKCASILCTNPCDRHRCGKHSRCEILPSQNGHCCGDAVCVPKVHCSLADCVDPCNNHTCHSNEKCITADLEFGQYCPDAKCIPDQDCSQVDCAPPNACENHSCDEGYKCESKLRQGSCCETEALCVRDLDCTSFICPAGVMKPPPGTCQEGERLGVVTEEGHCCSHYKCIPDHDCSQVRCDPPNACQNHSCNEGYKCESKLRQGACCFTEAMRKRTRLHISLMSNSNAATSRVLSRRRKSKAC